MWRRIQSILFWWLLASFLLLSVCHVRNYVGFDKQLQQAQNLISHWTSSYHSCTAELQDLQAEVDRLQENHACPPQLQLPPPDPEEELEI